MAFAKKMMGFPSDLVSFPHRPNGLQKDVRKSLSLFLQGTDKFECKGSRYKGNSASRDDFFSFGWPYINFVRS